MSISRFKIILINYIPLPVFESEWAEILGFSKYV
jgi:hypothetical protein